MRKKIKGMVFCSSGNLFLNKCFPPLFEFWKAWMRCQENILPQVGVELGSPDWQTHALPTELMIHLRIRCAIAISVTRIPLIIFKEDIWSGSRLCLNFERLREARMKCTRKIFCLGWELNTGPQIDSLVLYQLSYWITWWCVHLLLYMSLWRHEIEKWKWSNLAGDWTRVSGLRV